jgi:hypothetical protein
MLKKYIAISLLFVTTHAFAWFCPNNFNLIQAGDSLDRIKQQCGKPLSEKSSKTDAKTPQEWGYYVPMAQAGSATMKMTLALNQSGIVTNISLGSVSLSSTSICGGTISVGSTMEEVKAACGPPPFINKGQGGDKPVTVNELIYGGPPPNMLVFENGILTERR